MAFVGCMAGWLITSRILLLDSQKNLPDNHGNQGDQANCDNHATLGVVSQLVAYASRNTCRSSGKKKKKSDFNQNRNVSHIF
jgi:hypothetical protein